jgi:hypothetical protein
MSAYHQLETGNQAIEQELQLPLLHKGHSKDCRLDLLQYRQMLVTLIRWALPTLLLLALKCPWHLQARLRQRTVDAIVNFREDIVY